MQSLRFLDCFVQKLSKKNLQGVRLDPPPPLGKGRVMSGSVAGGEDLLNVQ